jgi:CelD/BcsL family acetyltransferase involved in cellulose biosynthesis
MLYQNGRRRQAATHGRSRRKRVTLTVEAAPFPGFATLGELWRGLEARADPAFFQSWTWMGCLAEERFPSPVLLRATAPDGTLAGLALFNRRDGALWLGASGDAALDAPYVEHNAPLMAEGADPAPLIAAAWRVPGVRRLGLPGVPAPLAAAAGGLVRREQAEPAPWLDLDAVRAAGGDYLATRSANTRQQLRRSLRAHAGLVLEEATETVQALDWLDALIALHQADWRRRGRPGAFAEPFMRRFHAALIPRALPRGEVALLRAVSGGRTIGYLYNLRLGGRVFAYQSGLDQAGAGAQDRPGLVLHLLAIQRALEQGMRSYDFLAGAARYKTSLANGEARLVWTERVRPWSLAGVGARLRALVRR